MTSVAQFFRNYKGRTAVTVLLMFCQTFGTLFIPTLMASIVNRGVVEGDLDSIFQIGGFMLLTAVGTAIVAILGAWLATELSARWGRDIREVLFDKVQRLSVGDFNRFGAASMITRCTNDVSQLQDSMLLFLQLILPAPLITVGGLVLAYAKDGWMALLIVAVIVVFLAVSVWICLKSIPYYHKLRIQMDGMNRTLRETITGVRVIRAFNRDDHAGETLNKTFQDYASTAIRVNKLFAVLIPLLMIIMNLCMVGIIWFGGMRASAGFMQLGDIMALTEYALLIFWNLVMGVYMLVLLPRAQTNAARINEILSSEPGMTDGAQKFQGKSASERPPMLELREVTFGYTSAEEPVLSELSFYCRPGETVAVIGGTGSGKSTVANLIMRFYDVQSGSIRVDGMDIREVPQALLREKIGFVPQKAFLFSGTIGDNLRYGNRDASLEDLEWAAKIAQASDFIRETGGYDATVTQGGANFSGGQRQRLCIARALVRRAPLYVFDDSFSALDYKTDSLLRAALRRELQDAAILVVAQRVSSILDADRIIVLDNGRVAGIGPHKELLETCDVYREIVKSQQRG